jgi:hypothetical protein
MPELTHAELCKIYQATGALARAAQLLGVGVTNEDGVVDFVVNDVPRSVEKLQADNSRLHRDLIAANNILLGKRAAIEERDKQIAANAGAAETMRLIEEHGLHIRRTSEGDKWFVLGGIHSMLGPDLAQCILWVGSMFAPPSSQSAATYAPTAMSRTNAVAVLPLVVKAKRRVMMMREIWKLVKWLNALMRIIAH